MAGRNAGLVAWRSDASFLLRHSSCRAMDDNLTLLIEHVGHPALSDPPACMIFVGAKAGATNSSASSYEVHFIMARSGLTEILHAAPMLAGHPASGPWGRLLHGGAELHA